MAGWASNNHQKLNSENDVLLGTFLSQKSGVDLLQNCDLPPPLKVFLGSDKTLALSSMNRVFSMVGREEDNTSGFDFDIDASIGGAGNQKLELLKALRLSQTRARKAEKKAAELAKEKDSVSNAFFQESMQLFAHRQWVRLLEVQVLKLQSEWQTQEKNRCSCETSGSGREGGGGVSWIVALALCLGIAGVGLAFGCSYLS